MGTPKNYSVKILDRSDEPRIAEIMRKNPNWKRKHARDQAAREKFMARIRAAGKPASPARQYVDKLIKLNPGAGIGW